MKDQPKIAVGILDRQTEVSGCLNGRFNGAGSGPTSGPFSAKADAGTVVLFDEAFREIHRSPSIRLTAQEGSTFSLFNVTVGNRFHWEKREDQTFQGDLVLLGRQDGTVVAVNQILVEDYLTSVISSEMNPAAPMEFLKAHAILSRSWLLASSGRRKQTRHPQLRKNPPEPGEVIRWYDREDHDLFEVCADDHCQRYQGITKVAAEEAGKAVRETCGKVIAYQDEICDARYSKACGGITEDFETAWDDHPQAYLRSVSDAPVPHAPIRTEEEARSWILSNPAAYCHTKDDELLEKILPDLDRKTKDFFRWTIGYSREELEEIVKEKSGFDFGTLRDIVPLQRGPSGRISRLRIVGSDLSMVVGKELEIRKWLSRSHLYSSAFVVTSRTNSQGEVEGFIFRGSGWGHGVGLCQIGAAVMATRGFSAEEILRHYFHNTKIEKKY